MKASATDQVQHQAQVHRLWCFDLTCCALDTTQWMLLSPAVCACSFPTAIISCVWPLFVKWKCHHTPQQLMQCTHLSEVHSNDLFDLRRDKAAGQARLAKESEEEKEDFWFGGGGNALVAVDWRAPHSACASSDVKDAKRRLQVTGQVPADPRKHGVTARCLMCRQYMKYIQSP